MIFFKGNVEIEGIKPELLLGLFALKDIFSANLQDTLFLTSVTDGRHSARSLHGTGYAADIRSKHMPPIAKERILETFSAELGHLFDLILEDQGGPNEHFHLEYDPEKTRSTLNRESV